MSNDTNFIWYFRLRNYVIEGYIPLLFATETKPEVCVVFINIFVRVAGFIRKKTVYSDILFCFQAFFFWLESQEEY